MRTLLPEPTPHAGRGSHGPAWLPRRARLAAAMIAAGCSFDRQATPGVPRSTHERNVTVPSSASAEEAEVARYLRSVAVVLAAPDATTERVLASARATDPKRQPYFVDFRPPSSRLGLGSVQLDRYDPTRRPPEAVDFHPDPEQDPITFQSLADVLGPWRQLPPGTSPALAILVRFEVPGALTRQLGHATVEVRFDAVLTAPPGDPAARVVRIGMRRDVFE